MSRLFVDLDGVLSDFAVGYERLTGVRPGQGKVDWAKVEGSGYFYLDLPMMEDAPLLWAFVQPHNPTILTAVPQDPKDPLWERVAEAQKRLWCRDYLGAAVPVITCGAKDKSDYAKPGDVLVDDNVKYRARWEKAGAVWITHTSARESIAKLQELGYSTLI